MATSTTTNPDIVWPSDPVPEQKIPFIINDVYAPKIWAKHAYFFKLKPSTTPEKCFAVLREGLARSLSDMPRCGAQNKRGASGDPRDAYFHVNDQSHATFNFQDLSQEPGIPTYDELASKGFPLEFEFGVKLLPDTAYRSVADGDIQITAKLTLLKGGLCLSTAVNHLLCDAAGLANNEKLWSLHTADVSAGRKRSHWGKQNSPKETEFLRSAKPNAGEIDEENLIQVPAAMAGLDLPAEVPDWKEAIETARRARAEAAEEPEDEFKWAIYRFSAESLRALRKAASRRDAPQPISRAAAVGGLFWSRASFIKQQSGDEDESSLYFPINVRHRLQPNIDPDFVANCVDIVPAKMSLKALEANDGSALVSAATSVSMAVNNWSQPRWEAWLNAAATLPADQAMCPNPLVMLQSQNIIFNDYSRTPTMLMDWGSDLGMIDRMRYPRPATGPATAIRVHPGLTDGSIEASATGTSALLEALAKDEVFRKYASVVCYPA